MMNEEQLQAIEERYTRDYGELPSAARADAPALVAEVRRLQAELAKCRVSAPKFLRAENQRLRSATQLFEEQLSRSEDEVTKLRAQLAGARLAGCAYRALSEIAPQWIDSDDALPTERGYYMARWSDKKVPAWFDPELMPSRGQWVLCDGTDKRCNAPIEWLHDGATTPDGAA